MEMMATTIQEKGGECWSYPALEVKTKAAKEHIKEAARQTPQVLRVIHQRPAGVEALSQWLALRQHLLLIAVLAEVRGQAEGKALVAAEPTLMTLAKNSKGSSNSSLKTMTLKRKV